jgi:hypothetical protein
MRNLMTLISFIIPTDRDILKDLKEEAHAIKFIGIGSFSQRIDEIKFSRTFKYRFDKQNTIKQAVYYRKGLIWKLSKVVSVVKEQVD